jgi:hypothetical protein
LTWSGLKVTHNNAEVNIGHNDLGNDKTAMIRVNNGKDDTFTVDQEGNVSMSGHIDATSGKFGAYTLAEYSVDNWTMSGALSGKWKIEQSSSITD